MRRAVFTLICILTIFQNSYGQSKATPDLNSSKVEIPWSELSKLLEKIQKPVIKPVSDTLNPAVDYLLSSAVISGTVIERKVARFSFEASVRVLPSGNLRKNGWVAVPLGSTGSDNSRKAVLEKAQLNGKDIPIRNENGKLEIFISRQGLHKLRLEYYCQIHNEEGNWKLSLDLPRVAAAQLTFIIPEMKAQVWINGLERDVRRENNATRFRSVVSLEEELIIRYSQTGDELIYDVRDGKTAPKMFASTGLVMRIKENRIDYQYRVDYQIWHQKRRSFSIVIPESLSVENVQGSGISEWKEEKRRSGSVITVWTSFAPDRSYTLQLELSKQLETTVSRVSLPSLEVLDVNRENGVVAISASKSTEVFAEDSMVNLTVADQSELPDWLRSTPDVLMCFKYSKTPYLMNLSVQRHKDMAVLVAIADEGSFTGIMTKEGYSLVRYRYFVRNNHKQFLRVQMPSEWELWSALIDGEAVMPASEGEQVLIPLKKLSRTDDGAGFVLELVYWNQGEEFKGRGQLQFSTPVMDINCQKLHGVLFLPDKYKYTGFEGSLHKVDRYQSSYLDNTDYSSSSSVRRRKMNQTMMNRMSIQRKGKVAMSLPVAVEIPRYGKSNHLSKNLTTAGETGHFSCRYSKESGFRGYIGSILVLALPFFGGLLISMLSLGRRSLRSKITGAISFTLSVCLFYLVFSFFSVNTAGVFGAAFLGGATALLGYLGNRNRGEKTV